MEGRYGGSVQYIMGLGEFASPVVLQNLVGNGDIILQLVFGRSVGVCLPEHFGGVNGRALGRCKCD